MMIYIWFPWSLINFGDNDHWFNDSMIIDFSDNVIISIIDIDHVMVILIRKKKYFYDFLPGVNLNKILKMPIYRWVKF
jgi:hypothetical protein